MKKYIKIIVKTLILLVLVVAYNAFLTAYEPIFTNEMAMQQMQNYDTSSAGIAAYYQVKNYAWTVFLVVGGLLFANEISTGIQVLTKKIKKTEEKNNEEFK